MLALFLALMVALGGTLLTYLYDRTSPLLVRFAIGVCSGFAWFATVAFALSCLFGLNGATIALSFATVCLPLWLTRNVWRDGLASDINDIRDRNRVLDDAKSRWVCNCGLVLLLGLVAWAMAGVSYEKPEGLFTAYETNIGDLTLHFQIITGFAWGGNFPPQNPIYAGSLFVYPFLPDFLSAIWLRCGASFPFAVVLQTEMLAFALVVLLQRFALELLRDHLAALIAPFLVIFSGGLGWLLFISDASDSPTGFRELLGHLPRQYTNFETFWRWSNALTTLFVTQRSLLLGMPLALTVLLLWWRFLSQRNSDAAEDGAIETPRFQSLPVHSLTVHPLLAAGFLASMLPLIHSHTFLVVALTSVYVALLIRPRSAAHRNWWFFYFALAPIAFVELAYFAVARRTQGAMVPGAFFAWNFGWDKGETEFFAFWLKNTGAFWPLIFFALWQRRESRAMLKRFAPLWAPLFLLYLAPFAAGIYAALWFRVLVVLFLAATPVLVARFWPRREPKSDTNELDASEKKRLRLRDEQHDDWRDAVLLLAVFVTVGFAMPNLFRFAPWAWDSNKILIYWFVVASPFAALGLAQLWRARQWRRALSVFLFVTLTGAGALDIWHGANGQLEQRHFDRDGMALASALRAMPQGTVVLHAPTYNSPDCLSGQRSVIGYIGHLSSYGFREKDYMARADEVTAFLRGDDGSDRVLDKYGATAFIIGPQEIDYMTHLNPPQPLAPPSHWNKWKKVGQYGEYTLYTTR